MTKLTDAEILAGAHPDTTHISDEFNYYMFDEPDWYFWAPNYKHFDLCSEHEHMPMGLRSLADIRELESLRAHIEEHQSLNGLLEMRVETLEKQLAKAKADGISEFIASDFTLKKRTKPSTYEAGVRDTLEAALNFANQLNKGE